MFVVVGHKFLLATLLVFFLVLTESSLSFAEETGSIKVDIKFLNGDRLDTWQTTIQVFQDNSDTSYVTIEIPEFNPYLIDSLPLGHKYTVKVYVNNMFAGQSFLNLEESEQHLPVNIPLSGGMRFIVFYDDGQTPIEGAILTIRSDDGQQWSQQITDDEGKTARVWLQSNNVVEDDYYIAEVLLDKDIIYSHTTVIFHPSAIGDIKIITPWPKLIQNRITIIIYNDVLQKVSKSDGEFVAELYDTKENKIDQFFVNSRGETYFSNLKVGNYFIQIVKTFDDPDQESEIWATKEITLEGKEESFSIFKKGVFAQRTCNCVAFRFDDVQDWYLRGPQIELMELFKQKNADLTIGIIGGFFGTDPHLVDYLKRTIPNENPTLEVASHSWSNIPLTQLSKDDQRELLVKTNEKLLEVLGVTPKVFIAPQNLFNADTESLLPELGLTHFSAHIDKVHSPPYLLENMTLYYFPANTETAKLNPSGNFWDAKPHSEIFKEVRSFLDTYGYAVVMMHPYEFAASELGVYTGEAKKQSVIEVGELIDALRDEGIKLVTLSEINNEIIEAPKPIFVKKPDDSQVESQSCNCVAFRVAPVQDYWLNDVQIDVMDIFLRKSYPITAGIIGNLFGEDVKLVDYLKNNLEKNDRLIEIANNGWSYEDFTALTSDEQSSLIKQSNDQISSVLGTKPIVFIPPYENFNDATILALDENNVKYISSSIKNDPPPYSLTNLKLYHFPSGVTIGKYDAGTGLIESIRYDKVFSEIQKNLDQYGFAVITVVPHELSIIKDGKNLNQVDEEKIHELELLLDRIQSEGLEIVSVGEIDLFAGGISIPDWVKNNAGWWSEGLIGDTDFVSGIQYLIKEGIMKIPPSTPGSTDMSDEIPSWIKNNAGWWATGVITDDEFVAGIQWLITNGVIKISNV